MKYSLDYIKDAMTSLFAAEDNFRSGCYTDELYHLQKAKSKIDKAIQKAQAELNSWKKKKKRRQSKLTYMKIGKFIVVLQIEFKTSSCYIATEFRIC